MFNHDEFAWSEKVDNCCVCGRLTHFIDLDFEAFVCSEECDEALTKEFFAINNTIVEDFKNEF